MEDAGQIATDPPAPTLADDHPSTLAPAENLPDDARTLAARASNREAAPAPPAAGRLLRRVADQLSDSFQNALAKVHACMACERSFDTLR